VPSCRGEFFGLRRDGVKNNRRFLNFVEISPSFFFRVREGVTLDSPASFFSTSAAGERLATAIDGGEESVVNAIVEAASSDDPLCGKPRAVDD
jgi:hypothetical protein